MNSRPEYRVGAYGGRISLPWNEVRRIVEDCQRCTPRRHSFLAMSPTAVSNTGEGAPPIHRGAACLWKVGAGEGNRTLISGLGSPHSTTEPHPHPVQVYLAEHHPGCKRVDCLIFRG
jgi:hypothetical protein